MSLSFQAKAAGVGALAGLAISGFLYSSLAPMQPAAATTPAAVTTPAEPVVVLRAVSYTHLDVYKRQALPTAPRSTLSPRGIRTRPSPSSMSRHEPRGAPLVPDAASRHGIPAGSSVGRNAVKVRS